MTFSFSTCSIATFRPSFFAQPPVSVMLSVAPAFFATRAEGPKSVAKSEAQLAAEKQAAGSAPQAIAGPIKYNVTFAGRQHSVSVEPV